MDELVVKLGRFGLSQYEAKALLALIARHPASGYEIGKRAGIPTSKIYATLSRLAAKGIVLVDQRAAPVRYHPVPVGELTRRFRGDYSAAIDDLEADLASLRPLPDHDLSWNLNSSEAVLQKMVDLMRAATRVIFLSLWQKEHSRLAPEIRACRRRGVKVVLAMFGASGSRDPFTVPMAGCGITSKDRLKSRLSVALADSSQVVIAELQDEGESHGVWTTTPHVVLVAKEYIRHDIWGKMLIDELGGERFRQLCKGNALLSYLIRER